MKIRNLLAVLLLISNTSIAETLEVNMAPNKGPTQGLIIDKILNGVSIDKSGGNGTILFNSLVKDDNSVGLINSAMLNLQFKNFPDLNKLKVIGSVGYLPTYLVKAKNHKTSPNMKLGGVGINGYCETMLNYYSSLNNIKYKYIPYNNRELLDLDILAGRIDGGCIGGTNLLDYEVIKDFSDYNTYLTMYVVVNKNIDINKEKLILDKLNNANIESLKKEFKSIGFNLNIVTGDKLIPIIKQQESYWTTILNKGNIR